MSPITELLLHAAYTGAKTIIERGEQATAMALFYLSDQMAGMPMPFRDDREKDAYMRQVREICADPQTTGCALIAEAWAVRLKGKALTELSLMPADDPRRYELLTISVQERGGKTIMATAAIHRDPTGKRCLGPCEIDADGEWEGRMVNVFGPAETQH